MTRRVVRLSSNLLAVALTGPAAAFTLPALALALPAAILPAPTLHAQTAPPPDTLRILAYNTHHGAGLDEVLDLERIPRVISEVDPHMVALPEILCC